MSATLDAYRVYRKPTHMRPSNVFLMRRVMAMRKLRFDQKRAKYRHEVSWMVHRLGLSYITKWSRRRFGRMRSWFR